MSAATLALIGPGEWSLDARLGHRLNQPWMAAADIVASSAASLAIVRRRRVPAARTAASESQAVEDTAATRARRLTDAERRRLQQIVRRGKHGSIRVRRALIIMASASGTPVPAIARLVAAHEDTVRDVIHRFKPDRAGCAGPSLGGWPPRRISDEQERYIVRDGACPLILDT